MTEQWKTIPAFNEYEISDLGNVRRIKDGKILTQRVHESGYKVVKLKTASGYRIPVSVYRMVALMFVENPYRFSEILHIDYDITNDASSNLKWVQPLKNWRKVPKEGRQVYGK